MRVRKRRDLQRHTTGSGVILGAMWQTALGNLWSEIGFFGPLVLPCTAVSTRASDMEMDHHQYVAPVA